MQLDVKGIKGWPELQAAMKDFSERRAAAAMATALTRSAKALGQKWQGQIDSAVDRPVARTTKATGFVGAQAANLVSKVIVKNQMDGVAPAAYLGHHETGSPRLVKKFEAALVNSGAMPSGYVTVPGQGALLDGYGNVSRAQIIAVIAQLGRDFSPGYQRTISKSTEKRLARQQKMGRTYLAVLPGDASRLHLSPGIYERMPNGHRKAVFLYKRGAFYRKRLHLLESAADEAAAIVEREARIAIAESASRLAARGAR